MCVIIQSMLPSNKIKSLKNAYRLIRGLLSIKKALNYLYLELL